MKLYCDKSILLGGGGIAVKLATIEGLAEIVAGVVGDLTTSNGSSAVSGKHFFATLFSARVSCLSCTSECLLWKCILKVTV